MWCCPTKPSIPGGKGYYSQTVYPYSNYAPGFFTFLKGSQLTPWRDIFFRVCETWLFGQRHMRNPTVGLR